LAVSDTRERRYPDQLQKQKKCFTVGREGIVEDEISFKFVKSFPAGGRTEYTIDTAWD